MNRLSKMILAIMLIIAIVIATGCTKTDEPNNGGGNGNNNGNNGETPEVPAVVSTSEVQYDGKVFVEAIFEDETKMYFEIISPNEVSLVNGEFYYQDEPSLAYKYRGEVFIPESIKHLGTTYFVVSITKKAFYNNWIVTSVHIPNTVTTIGIYAFYNCILTEILLPSSIQIICERAFSNIEASGETSTTKITCKALNPPILGLRVFEARCVEAIYVPASSVEMYRTAEGWSQYADVIVGI